jgi:hypothetical protein
MLNKIKQLINLLRKKILGGSPKTIHHSELSVNRINAKIKSELRIKQDFINLAHYEIYFNFLTLAKLNFIKWYHVRCHITKYFSNGDELSLTLCKSPSIE